MQLFDELDAQPRLTPRQKLLAGVATAAVCLEFLDYFLIGFILTFVSSEWHLTFGQSSLILLSSGFGAIAGAMFFGRLADRIGRRRVFLITITIFTLATAAMALTPDSPSAGWIYLAVLRVVVGFGAGGLYVVDLPMVQEFIPAAKRGRVTGYVTASVPLGFLAGSVMVWLLADVIGWRGILLIAGAAGLALLLVRLTIPESPRYLARCGEWEQARRSVAWALHRDPATLPLDTTAAAEQPTAESTMGDLFVYRRSLALSAITNLGAQTGLYGIALWAPTLLVMVLGVAPSQAALYMVFVTVGALAGRFALANLAEAIGRRRSGALAAFAAAGFIIVAATVDQFYIAGVSMFLVALVVVYFFAEGGFAIVGPYSGEVWPGKLRTTGMGFAYGIGGTGKVIGPLGLGLIVGSGSLVRPDVSTTSLLPAFGYFAAWYVLCGLAFLILGFETRGKNLEDIDTEIERQRRGAGSEDTHSGDVHPVETITAADG